MSKHLCVSCTSRISLPLALNTKPKREGRGMDVYSARSAMVLVSTLLLSSPAQAINLAPVQSSQCGDVRMCQR
jgi:hypothetical protein